MPTSYLLDEHLRGPLWQAIQSHNARGVDPIEAVRVGDLPDLPLGSQDPDILIWAEREDRILLSRDVATMKSHLATHLGTGRHSPGLLLIDPRSTLNEVVDFLVAVVYASDPHEWRDRYNYIP